MIALSEFEPILEPAEEDISVDTNARKAHNPKILVLKKASLERNARVLAVAISTGKVSKRKGQGATLRALRSLD